MWTLTLARLTRRPLAIALAVGAAIVAIAGPVHAVANGDPVPERRYGFAVKLTATNIPRPDGGTYESACSAALIAPQWVITAGHCFHDVNRVPVSGSVPYPTTVTILRDRDAATVANIVEVRQAPSGDIALARLDSAVTEVAPLELSRWHARQGNVLRVVGWGKTDPNQTSPGSVPRTGQVTITSVTRTVVKVVGLAPSTTTSACTYDSGAPYFIESPRHRMYLVSVENDGPTCPHSQEETTSRVEYVLPWIAGVIGADMVEGG
jgi:secreted trypsin-like serine protease